VADEGVVPFAAIQLIVEVVADENVIEHGPIQVLDLGDGVDSKTVSGPSRLLPEETLTSGEIESHRACDVVAPVCEVGGSERVFAFSTHDVVVAVGYPE
jgi:hypothetical protein